MSWSIFEAENRDTVRRRLWTPIGTEAFPSTQADKPVLEKTLVVCEQCTSTQLLLQY